MKSFIAAICFVASAAGIAHADTCDNKILQPKILASLRANAADLGGKVKASSLRVTPLIPPQYVPQGAAPILAVIQMVAPKQDGSRGTPGLFAAQFLVDYDTCTPKFNGMGRLGKY